MSGYQGPGYMAFGVDSLNEPLAKEVGPLDFPEAEINKGIVRIEVKLYGDSDDALIRVIGTSPAVAAVRWRAIRNSLAKTKAEWLP